MIETVDQATGELIAPYEGHDSATIEHVLTREWEGVDDVYEDILGRFTA